VILVAISVEELRRLSPSALEATVKPELSLELVEETSSSRGLGARTIEHEFTQHRIEAVIPPRKGTKGRDDYARKKYKWRRLIENFVCRIKAFRRIVMRYEKTDIALPR